MHGILGSSLLYAHQMAGGGPWGVALVLARINEGHSSATLCFVWLLFMNVCIEGECVCNIDLTVTM